VLAKWGGTVDGPFDLSTYDGQTAMAASATDDTLKGLLLFPTPDGSAILGMTVKGGTSTVVKGISARIGHTVHGYLIDGTNVNGLEKEIDQFRRTIATLIYTVP
jgi:hypothetical protein